MDYKCVPFEPSVGRKDPVAQITEGLDAVIKAEATGDWEFVGLENHSTVVPGSNGCFGLGAQSPYVHTHSVAVFRK